MGQYYLLVKRAAWPVGNDDVLLLSLLSLLLLLLLLLLLWPVGPPILPCPPLPLPLSPPPPLWDIASMSPTTLHLWWSE
jgi:hypothetical protein